MRRGCIIAGTAIVLLTLLLGFSRMSFAGPSSSSSFRLLAQDLNGGGGFVTSSNAEYLTAVCQAGPVGRSSSESFTIEAGIVPALAGLGRIAPSGSSVMVVNVDSNGVQSNGVGGFLSPCAISGDGSIVAFASTATNLVASDYNEASDVFVRDIRRGTTTRVSVGSGGEEANSDSLDVDISDDANVVAFESLASNLSPGTVLEPDSGYVFVHDRTGRSTSPASILPDGRTALSAFNFAMTGNGRIVAFVDSSGFPEILYFRDLFSRTTVRLGPGLLARSNGDAGDKQLSADGRYVLLWSDEGDGFEELVRFDRVTNTTVRVTPAFNGGLPNYIIGWGTISGDGRFVAFVSSATNLVPGDINTGQCHVPG